MDAKIAAQAIRTELKAYNGWNAKAVGVRINRHSMGSSIQVTIHSPAVNRETVLEIAKGFQEVSRCAITGEILGGGNMYVFVDYSRKCLATMAARYEAAVREVLAQLPLSSSDSHEVVPGIWLGRDGYLTRLTVTDGAGGTVTCTDDVRKIASMVSELVEVNA